MRSIADIAVYDRKGRLALIVELKSKLGTSTEWAAKMRRNILAHGLLPETCFFLLALPDRFYLWDNAGITPEIVQPTYEVDATPFLQPYYEKSGISPKNLSENSFDVIVLSFLRELSQTNVLPKILQQNPDWLIKSGLLEALREADLAREVRV